MVCVFVLCFQVGSAKLRNAVLVELAAEVAVYLTGQTSHIVCWRPVFMRFQVERAKLEKAVEEELAAEAAADEAAKQQKREQIAAEERRLQELEEKRQAEVRYCWC